MYVDFQAKSIPNGYMNVLKTVIGDKQHAEFLLYQNDSISVEEIQAKPEKNLLILLVLVMHLKVDFHCPSASKSAAVM